MVESSEHGAARGPAPRHSSALLLLAPSHRHGHVVEAGTIPMLLLCKYIATFTRLKKRREKEETTAGEAASSSRRQHTCTAR
jgi:hypothetical protein